MPPTTNRHLTMPHLCSLFLLLILTFLSACSSSRYYYQDDVAATYSGDWVVPHQVIQWSGKPQLLLDLPKGSYRITAEGRRKASTWEAFYEYDERVVVRDDGPTSLPLPQSPSGYALNFTVYDTERSYRFIASVQVPVRDLNGQMLPLTDERGTPILKPYVYSGTEIEVPRECVVRYYDRQFGAAPPPTSDRDPVFNADRKVARTTRLKAGEKILLRDEGLYLFQYEASGRYGRYIRCVDDAFPKLTRAKDLLETIRYITLNDEYKRLQNASHPKEALDAFWLSRTDDKARARLLIRTFYSRVEYANRRFTDYKPGWKTDRGLIYLIFGEPDEVYLDGESEVWVYDATQRRDTVRFRFERVFQQYLLKRSSGLKRAWDTEIYEWRKGKF